MLYRASIAEIPLLWGGGGYRTSTLHTLQGGEAQKRGTGCRTELVMLRRQKTSWRAIGGLAWLPLQSLAVKKELSFCANFGR